MDFACWLELPTGATHVAFGQLPDLMAQALRPIADVADDVQLLRFGAAQLTLASALRQAAGAGGLQVRDPLTLGPHPFPFGAALDSAVVWLPDLRAFLAPRGIGVRVGGAGGAWGGRVVAQAGAGSGAGLTARGGCREVRHSSRDGTAATRAQRAGFARHPSALSNSARLQGTTLGPVPIASIGFDGRRSNSFCRHGRNRAAPAFSPHSMNSNPTLSTFGSELAALVPRLRRFGRLLTGHQQDADDLVQHALERAWMHRARWEPGTRLDSWVLRIMHNAWIDEVRARQRKAQVLTPSEELEQFGDESVAASPVDAIAVRQALARLRDEQRAAVVLVLIDGLSYKEAAHVLEIPMGTLTSRLARGREHLQALLSSKEKRSCPT